MRPSRRTASPARRFALVCALATVVVGAVAAPVLARTDGGSTKSVSASISYLDGSKAKVPVWKDIKITIKLADRTLASSQLLPERARESYFAAPKLLAVDLDDDGEAEVIVDVFTAGADCCRRSVVYHREGDAYEPQVLDWQDSGYRLDDVTGQSSPEFLASDSRFPRAWDSDARGPIQILAMRNGTVRDISRRVRPQLLRDAKIQLRAWRAIRRKNAGDARPVVAAYVADLVRLGDIPEARDAIRNASAHDELRASRAAFTRSLDRKLVSWGYAKHAVLSR